MLFLPECFGFMGTSAEQTLAEADPPIVIPSSGGRATNDDDTATRKNDASISALLRETVASCNSQGEGEPDTKLSNKESLNSSSPSKICILDALKEIAQESKLWISAGGMHVSGAPPAINDDGSSPARIYNTHVILNAQGVVQCLYRKIHLFDVHIPDKVNLQESKTTAPGTELVVCDSPLGRLGLSTCYDMRFPEQYVRLVHEMGAQVLLVPSAFTVPTGRAHWHILLRSRAIEHQCYVLAAAQYGQHNEKRESYGTFVFQHPQKWYMTYRKYSVVL